MHMNNVIDSITDYKPEDTFLLPAQFDIIKDQVEGVPFEISNEELAGQLIYAEMIKREEVRVPREEYDGDPESYPFDNMRRTGKYLLSPKGIRKVIYENQKAKEIRTQKRNNWIQFWIPVCLSAVALAVSIIALLLELKVIQPKQQPKIEVETTDVSQPNYSSDQ